MLDAPQHDWSFYEAKTRGSDAAWNCGLSTQERFDLYASLFNTIWNARQKLPGDWERLEEIRWQEKLEVRQKLVHAFRKLDQYRERVSKNNPS
jgi:hypothetical protein